ncbi:hypothetical protein CHS0354_019368 [Potamilus streckersoni]|uniref:Uncharacterized protein n=1 Tax=Potamilus streckersoni TaxID=2493646 RepID=A0AAE0SIJ6_9BIVA|nr:hypothetical protein CHS0354_019368 [Potamilus streckersoni]
MSSGRFDTDRLILVDDMIREYGCPCLFQRAFSEDDEGDAEYPQFTTEATGAIGKIEKITSLQTAKIRILHDGSMGDGRCSRNPVERSSFEGCEINIPVGCPIRVTRSDNKKEYSSISQVIWNLYCYLTNKNVIKD